jgi:hypothetical protein
MKAALAAVPALRLSRFAPIDTAQLWRLAGLAIAVAVPVAFWTVLLVLLGSAFDVAIGPVGLTLFAVVIGLSCLLGASAVMGADAGGRS